MKEKFLNLPRYASLLKNLRGVVFFDPHVPFPAEEVRWLKRRFRYRSLGVSESLVIAIKDEEKELFLEKPFEILKPPLLEIENFIKIIEATGEAPTYAVESLILTSCYVNALIVLGRDSLSTLNPFIIWAMRSTSELTEVEIKRNLRLIGYAIIDFHSENAVQAYYFLKEIAEKIKEKEKTEKIRMLLERFLNERKRLAGSDGEKRFWRLRQTGRKEERIIVCYLDVIPLISRILLHKESIRLTDFVSQSTLNLSMALSLIPTFILQL